MGTHRWNRFQKLGLDLGLKATAGSSTQLTFSRSLYSASTKRRFVSST